MKPTSSLAIRKMYLVLKTRIIQVVPNLVLTLQIQVLQVRAARRSQQATLQDHLVPHRASPRRAIPHRTSPHLRIRFLQDIETHKVK